MTNRCLRLLPLLILGLALSSYGQSSNESLVDAARQSRIQILQSSTHPKVITNDDLEPAREAAPAESDDSATEADAGSEDAAQAEGTTADDKKGDKNKQAAKKNSEKDWEQREEERQKRSDEINQHYIDQIQAIRQKIADAQKEIDRLQRDQTESTIAFQRSVGTDPTVPQYQEQQRVFNDQLETQRQNITNLNSELEDARESARHAGVPHTDDY